MATRAVDFFLMSPHSGLKFGGAKAREFSNWEEDKQLTLLE
jgi:hypothetical protein